VATRDNRMVLLRLPEVSYAESEGNNVWLSTDQGRLRASSPVLDKLEGELADAGFVRVHRRYVVDLSRVQVIERGLKAAGAVRHGLRRPRAARSATIRRAPVVCCSQHPRAWLPTTPGRHTGLPRPSRAGEGATTSAARLVIPRR
jgi:LytTr DNA-binding domain